MKQALIFIAEINRKKQAIRESKSKHLKTDYTKSIKDDIEELKDYCEYRNIDYKELEKLIR